MKKGSSSEDDKIMVNSTLVHLRNTNNIGGGVVEASKERSWILRLVLGTALNSTSRFLEFTLCCHSPKEKVCCKQGQREEEKKKLGTWSLEREK